MTCRVCIYDLVIKLAMIVLRRVRAVVKAFPREMLNNDAARLKELGIQRRPTLCVENAIASKITKSTENPVRSTSNSTSSSLPSLSNAVLPPKVPTTLVAQSSSNAPVPKAGRAGVLDIISDHLGTSSFASKTRSLDPNVPRGSTGFRHLGKANKAIWKHRIDMKVSVGSSTKQKKPGKNAIQEMYGSGIMAEVEEIEKKRFFDELLQRKISIDPNLTSLETMEEELHCQQQLGDWDPAQFDFVARFQ